MKTNFNIFRTLAVLATAFALVFSVSSCKEEEEPLPDPIASFQYAVSSTNFLEYTFTSFSQNATSWSWNFGDGSGTSTEENPTYAFSAEGTYTVVLTASNADGVTSTFSEDITVTDPDAALKLLAGEVSRVWKLYRVGTSMSLGPNAANPAGWWAGLTNDGSRNCLYDDEFTFHFDGTYEYDSKNSFWGEFGVWPSDDPNFEKCFEPTPANMVVNGVDVSAWNTGSHQFAYDPQAGTVTLTGTGAWMGIPKLGTTGDHGTNIPTTITFNATIEEDVEAGVDVMTVTFDYGDGDAGGGGLWTFKYASYDDWNNEPDLVQTPTAKFSAAFGDARAVTFSNASTSSVSYAWDFGDGATSTEEAPSHTYSAAGCYTVTLTATGATGATDVTTLDIVVTDAATFDPAILSSATGKAWTLAGVGSYKVGPAPGSGEWWPGLDPAGVEERACQIDDQFIFFDDGSFHIDNQGSTFAETYMGGTNACVDPSTLAAPFNGYASSTSHTYTATAENVTVVGAGAYLGFNKAYNGGEIASTATELPAQISYNVVSYGTADCADLVTLAVDIAGDGGAWWTITLKYNKQ